MDEIRQKIKDLIKKNGGDLKNVSEKVLHKNHAYLHQYLERGVPQELGDPERMLLAHWLEINPIELVPMERRNLYERGLSVIKSPPTDMAARLPKSEFVFINQMEISSAASPAGAHVEHEGIKRQIAFRADWLRDYTSASAEDLAVINVQGDSMEPTLHSGDQILVDTTVKRPTNNGIYVLRYDGGLLVKRISIDMVRKKLFLTSDNEHYAQIEPATVEEVQIVGRVIWMGRKVW